MTFVTLKIYSGLIFSYKAVFGYTEVHIFTGFRNLISYAASSIFLNFILNRVNGKVPGYVL